MSAVQLCLRAAPYLIVLAFASNIGGTATLIGDPANIIIASRADPSFNDILIHLTPIVVVLLAVFIGLCWLMFRRQLQFNEAEALAVMDLWPTDAITDGRVLRCLAVSPRS